MFDGVFGSQSAYFFRRLRLAAKCASHERVSQIQRIATSATLGDPVAHITALSGCPFVHVGEEDNGAPRQTSTRCGANSKKYQALPQLYKL